MSLQVRLDQSNPGAWPVTSQPLNGGALQVRVMTGNPGAVPIRIATGGGTIPIRVMQGSLGVTDPISDLTFAFRLQTHLGDNIPLGLYKDAAMTQPATADGDSVVRWRDELSGSGVVASLPFGTVTLRFINGIPVLSRAYGTYFTVPSRAWFPSKRGALYWGGQTIGFGNYTIVDTATAGSGTTFNWYALEDPYQPVFDAYIWYDGTLRTVTSVDFGWENRAFVRTGDTTAQSWRSGVNEFSVTIANNQPSNNAARILNNGGYVTALIVTDVGSYESRIANYISTISPSNVSWTTKIAHVGNSLTAGQGENTYMGSTPWQMNALINDSTVGFRIFGVPSATGAQLNTASTGGVARALSWLGGSGTRVAVCDEVTNSLYFGANATTAYNDLVTMCTTLRNAGALVIVKTPRPRTDAGTPGSFETDRQTVITSIRANWATFADALADLAADSRIGDALDSNDTTYYNADKVHMNDAGYAIDASITKAAYDTLFQSTRVTDIGDTRLTSGGDTRATT